MAVTTIRQSATAPPSSAGDGASAGQQLPQPMPFTGYCVEDFHDEMFLADDQPRPYCRPLFERLQRLSADDLHRRQLSAERSMLRLGITFNVYGDRQGTERIIPFDILPRIIQEQEWCWIERG